MVLNILLFLFGASVYGGIIRAIDPTAGPPADGVFAWWSGGQLMHVQSTGPWAVTHVSGRGGQADMLGLCFRRHPMSLLLLSLLPPRLLSSLPPLALLLTLCCRRCLTACGLTCGADLYRGVFSVVLGQQLPADNASGVPSQTFAVAVSVLGLTSFALVLALMEQVSWACSCLSCFGAPCHLSCLLAVLASSVVASSCPGIACWQSPCFRLLLSSPQHAWLVPLAAGGAGGAGAQRAAGQRGVRERPRGRAGLVQLGAGTQPAAEGAGPGAPARRFRIQTWPCFGWAAPPRSPLLNQSMQLAAVAAH